MWSRFVRTVVNSQVTKAIVKAVVITLAELARRWASEGNRKNGRS